MAEFKLQMWCQPASKIPENVTVGSGETIHVDFSTPLPISV